MAIADNVAIWNLVTEDLTGKYIQKLDERIVREKAKLSFAKVLSETTVVVPWEGEISSQKDNACQNYLEKYTQKTEKPNLEKCQQGR